MLTYSEYTELHNFMYNANIRYKGWKWVVGELILSQRFDIKKNLYKDKKKAREKRPNLILL